MRYIGTISKYFHFPYEGMYSKSDIEYIEKTVTGNGYVDLLTAKSGSLSNLTLFGGTEQRNVPEGYTELDYIRNVSNVTKFDTGMNPLVGDTLELVRTAGATDQSNYLLQSREGTTAGIYGISGSQRGATIIGSWGSGQSVTSNILRTNGHKYYTKMSVTATTLTMETRDLTNNLSDTQNISITAEDGAVNYFIRGNSVQFLNTQQNIYYARISNNGVDRIRLIPAKQGDTVGFYDMVSKTFMTTFVGDTPIPSSAEATVHPYISMNIVTNNGALKVSRNLFDKDNTPILNIAIQNGKYVSNSERYGVAIKVQPSTTYTFSFTQSVARVFINIGLSDTAPAINGACTYLSAGTVDSYTLTTESTTQYVYIYTTSSNFVDTVQFELGSNATPYHEYGIYTDGNVETVKDSGNRIATAEMLLKIGDYVDTQEVLSGNITRKVGIKVFDGTETLQEYTGVGGRYRYTAVLPNSPSLNGIAYCSHFAGGKTLAEINADTTITQAVGVYTSKLRFYTTTYETLSDFTSFLAEQYAKGTPVIAIYTLATATTETTTAQTLNVKSGTNKIEIVQASIDNLGISATYLSRE